MLALLAQADAAGVFLKDGLLGAAVVALCGVIYSLYKDFRTREKQLQDQIASLQNDRVKDANTSSERVVQMTGQCVAALTTVATAMEAQQEAMTNLRSALEKSSSRR